MRRTSVASEADMKPGNRKGTNPGPPDRTRRTRRTAIVLRTPPRVLNSTAANCGPPFGTKRPQVQILSPRPVFPQVRGPAPSGVRPSVWPVPQRSTATRLFEVSSKTRAALPIPSKTPPGLVPVPSIGESMPDRSEPVQAACSCQEHRSQWCNYRTHVRKARSDALTSVVRHGPSGVSVLPLGAKLPVQVQVRHCQVDVSSD